MAVFSRAISAFVVLLLFSFSEAKEILVGGKTDAWKIPSSQSDSLNQWAGSSRFRIGDSLVWKYDGGKDSVLQVSKEDYANCNTSNPIEEHKDGNTKVKLDRSGAFYFISGAEGHCQKGQKLVVVVISPRRTVISPAPSPVEFEGPAVAPTSSATRLQSGLMVAMGVFALGLF
ncbi:early nodulin-like protein 15 [Corylus avellana]|uniref:early nodulin-like protein 15 n=1 Tax=Corylus avellana TaxID=13451 RepID=UPI001E23101E|nr:early nodulin-like protein 15 [Corylus avellana]